VWKWRDLVYEVIFECFRICIILLYLYSAEALVTGERSQMDACIGLHGSYSDPRLLWVDSIVNTPPSRKRYFCSSKTAAITAAAAAAAADDEDADDGDSSKQKWRRLSFRSVTGAQFIFVNSIVIRDVVGRFACNFKHQISSASRKNCSLHFENSKSHL